MTSYTLARATPADIDAIVRIVNGAYRGTDGKAGWTSEVGLIAGSRMDTAAVTALLNQTNPIVLVLRDAQRVVATVCLDAQAPHITELCMLSVDVSLQAAGVGRQLLALTEDFVRQQGVTHARMTVVNARTELIAWYGRRGYLPTGETVAFPYDDPSVGQPLREDLHFVVLEKQLA